VSSRNLVLVLIAGFVLALGAASAARRDPGRSDQRPASTAASTAPEGTGGVKANLVTGTLPADRVIRAVVGDDIELRVTSQAPDVAKIVEFGVQTAVGPGLPGTVRFRALWPGRFPVTLDVAGVEAGAVVIVAADGKSPAAAG